MENETVLQVKNLAMGYGRNEVFTNVNFKVTKGNYISIVGPKGSGKATSMKCLLGLLPCAEGSEMTVTGIVEKYVEEGSTNEYIRLRDATFEVSGQ